MTTPLQPPADAVHLLLGLPAHARDDRSLLGLPPEPCAKPQVITALRSRLALVASHPMGATSQASEVRMLLHAAATRLLLGAEVSAAPHTLVRDQPGDPATPPRSEPPPSEFEHAAILTLAMHGGWNKASLHRLRLVAQSAGVPPQDFVHAIQALMQRPWAGGRAGGAATAPRRAAAARSAEDVSDAEDQPADDPGRTLARRLLIGSATAVVTLIIFAIGLRAMLRPAAAPTPPGPAIADASRPAGSGPSVDTTAPPAPAPTAEDKDAGSRTPVDPAAVVAAVRTLAAPSQTDAAVSPDDVARVYAWSAVRWADSSPAQLASLVDAWGELAYRLPAGADATARLVEAIDADLAPLTQPASQWTAAQVRRAVWASIVSQRLGSEPELDTQLRAPLRRTAQAALGPLAWDRPRRTRDALLASLQAIARRILAVEAAMLPEPAPTWAIWSAGVAQVRGMSTRDEDAGAAQELALDVLDRALTQSADAAAPALLAALTAASSHLDLGAPASPARARVLGWLGDERLTQADVSALMTALTARPEHGLDASMTISALGDPAQREQVRTRLAAAWRLPVGLTASSAARDRWRQASSSVLAMAPPAAAADSFAALPRIALLNLAAHHAWEGDAAGADAALSQLGALSSAASASPRASAPGAAALGVATSWGQRYLLAGNNTLTKLDLLRAAASPPSPLEARIIVQETVGGSTVEVRREGLRLLELHSGSLNIAIALLNAAHRLPPVREISAVIERVTTMNLPAPRDPAWRVAVRRALVLSTLSRLRTDDASAIDLASSGLADAYARRLGRTGGPSADAAAEVAGVRAMLASRARALWQPPWDRLTVESADALLAQRRRAARGPLQLAVAEQVGVVEQLAILTAAEREGARAQLAAVLDTLRTSLADAEHVAQQLYAAEVAQARVWSLRLGETTP